jgi:hypothetical protein
VFSFVNGRNGEGVTLFDKRVTVSAKMASGRIIGLKMQKAKAQAPLPFVADTLPRVFRQSCYYCRALDEAVAAAAALKRITPELSVK